MKKVNLRIDEIIEKYNKTNYFALRFGLPPT